MRKIIGFTLILLVFGCSSFSDTIIPELSQRTIRLSRDFPGGEYQYDVCIKKILGVCLKREHRVDKYDLTDPAVRNQLVDMGFVLMVEVKPLP